MFGIIRTSKVVFLLLFSIFFLFSEYDNFGLPLNKDEIFKIHVLHGSSLSGCFVENKGKLVLPENNTKRPSNKGLTAVMEIKDRAQDIFQLSPLPQCQSMDKLSLL